MNTAKESKKLIKYKPGKEYIATIQCTLSSTTHTITYKGDLKEGFFLKDLALGLIKIFGKSFTSAVGEIPNSLFAIIFFIVSFFFSAFFLSVANYYTSERGILLAILLSGFVITTAVPLKLQYYYIAEYYRNTVCNNCGKEFICRETEKPDIKEISTPETYRIQITRYWSCRSCGYMNVRESSEGFVTKKGKTMKVSDLAKVQCKRCGKTGTYIEYKKPDIRVSKEQETMERRYYRCKLCNYEDIAATEFFMVPDSGGVSAIEWNIDYEDYFG
ncbi:hypothetical protein [Methanosarcina mazei]|jgi:DNA-directed RNA polymerase subunit RPC12/RpoP|uniref:Uncharacterized protein n=1 Tax=Methanosarcina mazei LYC TaxID=1434114 RepID=A0A0E3RPL8_METMZ|nr:hypothetical protein [Methanosarcina mazei]AKB66625.1 hypothetical protein MSMAL_0082 [Methanosarcina mazei LYC]